MTTTVQQATAATNADWFHDNDNYVASQSKLEVYQHIRKIVQRELRGVRNLLDVGNGGFFNYDTATVGHATAVDLFLADGAGPTPNSTFRKGSFLDLPFPDGGFDCVLQQNVLHHVTGKTVAENHANMRRCIAEMHRVVEPGGKAVMIESTVGAWFHLLECAVYRPALWLKRGGHPVTFQFTPRHIIRAATACGFEVEEFTYVPLGAFVLQFGHTWPSCLTPVKPIKLVLRK